MSTVVTTPTAAQMNAPKNAAGLGKGTPPATCGNNHTWECNKYSCPNCWPVPCPANAAQEDKEYQETQAGSEEDRIKAKHTSDAAKDKTAKANQKAKGQPEVGDPGARMESAAVRKAVRADETIEHITYWAHCSVCHWQQEVDLVTDTSVKEAKASAGGFKADQTARIRQIRDQCFPGKDLKLVTAKDEVPALEKKMAEREWQAAIGPRGAEAQDP